MTKTTAKSAPQDLDAATLAHLKLLQHQRQRAARALLKRRRRKSNQ